MNGQLYVHIKSGELYTLNSVGKNEATEEYMACYTHVTKAGMWIRPLTEFREKFVNYMTRQTEPREDIQLFALQMEYELRKHKAEKIDYHTPPPVVEDGHLRNDMKVQLASLCVELNKKKELINNQEIQKRCVHIANFAMMIATRARLST